MTNEEFRKFVAAVKRYRDEVESAQIMYPFEVDTTELDYYLNMYKSIPDCGSWEELSKFFI